MNARRSGSYRAAALVGRTEPLEVGIYGAHFDEAANGTRFVVPVSERASHVEVALLDGVSGEERRVPMAPVRGSPWRHEVFVPGVGPGTAYGYRVAGPWNPSHGDRFNNAKLLIDPWARRLSRSPELPPGSAPAIFLHQHADGSPNSARAPHSLRAGHHPCGDNDAALKPCSLVTSPWKTRAAALGTRPPRPAVPAHRTVVYEAHVKGLTMRHPAVPEALRGRYGALGHPAIVEHLQALGITTLELLPVHRMETEWWLKDRGFTNYWGYSPLGFLCVDDRFATDGGDPALELAGAVDALHRAGIEVILDVVYNHTCEGGTLGPTFGFRGFGDALWYRKRGSEYTNESGCGNTLDATSPIVQALVVDSLRFLYEEIGVDGFRFDLAPILGRGHDGRFDPRARLMAAIAEDPALAGAKLISEPWDLTGALAGSFPPPWHDWNDHFRDDLRRFFRGEAIIRSRFATRIGGSSDLFRSRGPLASVNFVTAHDGFTLRDLVSYDRKHNQANGEENRDGSDDNRSWNGGAEGETDDPAIRENRLRRAKSLFLTLALAKGIPMIVAGDERWRSQGGNNNPYCRDEAWVYVDWEDAGVPHEFQHFASACLGFRREFFDAAESAATFYTERDIHWLRADGLPISNADWESPDAATLAFAVTVPGKEAIYVACNGSRDAVRFRVPFVAALRISSVTPEPRIADGFVVIPAGGVAVFTGRAE